MSIIGGDLEVPDRSNEVILLHTILPSFTAVFIALRLYSRFSLLKSPGWDDLLLVIGWVSLLVDSKRCI